MRVPVLRWTLCWLGVCGGILISLILQAEPTDSAPARPVVASPSVAREIEVPTTTAPEADPFPPGCEVVEYTPPTATQPQLGELCVPEDPSGVGMVLVHGGGGTGGEYADADQWAEAYADNDVVTLAIDYRTLDPEVDRGIWPMPEQHTKAAVQFLRLNRADLGIESVQMHGWSAGARLAAIALTTPDHPDFDGPERWDGVSDRVDAAVLYYGYYDGFTYEPDAYWGSVEVPATAVPEEFAAQASGPALLVHGDIDFLVPASESIGFAARLRTEGADQTLWIVPDQPGHGFDGYGTEALTDAGEALVEPTLDWVSDAAGLAPPLPQ